MRISGLQNRNETLKNDIHLFVTEYRAHTDLFENKNSRNCLKYYLH